MRYNALRTWAWLCATVLLIGILSTGMAEAKIKEVPNQELAMKSRGESYNGVVEIEGETFVYFAQDSPEYSDINVGQGYRVTVGKNTCACVALANLIVNSVPYEELPNLRNMTPFAIRIDTLNISRERGYRERYSYEITRNEDYFRYLPLCIIHIATGNNHGFGTKYSTNAYYKHFLKCMSLEYKTSSKLKDCVDMVKDENAIAVVCAGGDSPIGTKFGHYLTIIKVVDEKVYFLDSIYRDSFPSDWRKVIHVQEPGVFWVYRKDMKHMGLHGTNYVAFRKDNRTTYTKEDYKALIQKSNQITTADNKVLTIQTPEPKPAKTPEATPKPTSVAAKADKQNQSTPKPAVTPSPDKASAKADDTEVSSGMVNEPSAEVAEEQKNEPAEPPKDWNPFAGKEKKKMYLFGN